MVDMNKFRFVSYTDGNGRKVIVAISTYAGKHIRGIAKCDPVDEFSIEKGKKLAAARCHARIAGKRLERAKSKLAKAEEEIYLTKQYYHNMQNYLNDANDEYLEALAEVDILLKSM